MPKTNLKTLAYNAIREKIVTCKYAPGTFLNEEMLTSELGFSRTPIRDALSRLEQEGLVQIKSKRGIIVTPLSVKNINMIFEMRSLFEPYILLNYGSMLPVDRLQEFHNIFVCSDTGNGCLEDNNRFYELDSAFHLMIVNACPNIYIRHNYNLILTQNERLRYMTGDVCAERLEDTFKEHLAIIRPCLESSWKEAAEKMAIHIEESKKASFRLIFESPQKQAELFLSVEK
ncbi:MAG: GntR family transcriptional regulator [Lachnospiraceae bacterium]|nr:GntR family transcriptional regulator [Lachnospiraceae bacterium]